MASGSGSELNLMVIGSGAAFSTKDVEVGYFDAFVKQGLSPSIYALDLRLGVAAKWIKHVWRTLYHRSEAHKPSWADVVYRGGIEALEMALRNQPDFVFCISAMYLHPDVVELMRRAGIRVAVLFTESPYEDAGQSKIARLANLCFTTERTSVSYLRQFNPNTWYISHAYNADIHYPGNVVDDNGVGYGVGSDSTGFDLVGSSNGYDVVEDGQLVDEPSGASLPRDSRGVIPLLSNRSGPLGQVGCAKRTSFEKLVTAHDVVFVGTAFTERIAALEGVRWRKRGWDLGLYGTFELVSRKSKLRRYIRQGVTLNSHATQLYKASKIGLNLYRTSKQYGLDAEHIFTAESANPRAFELAATKTFSISSWRPEAQEILGQSQVTLFPGDTNPHLISNGPELERLIKRYIRADDERETIAQEAFERVQGHTYDSRAVQVLAYLTAYLDAHTKIMINGVNHADEQRLIGVSSGSQVSR